MADPVCCRECGIVNETASAQMNELEEHIKQLGIEVARKQTQILRLKKTRRDERPAEYDDAMKVAVYWRDLIYPSARELNGDRIVNTIDRLQHGYDVGTLKRSVWGYYCKPYVKYGKRLRVNEGGVWKADLGYIMRTAELVDEGLRIADAEQNYNQELLNEGSSRYVAMVCRCGHPQADHALFRYHGHDQCLRSDENCTCTGFDDTVELIRRFEERQARKAHQTPPTPHGKLMEMDISCPPPSQGRLL